MGIVSEWGRIIVSSAFPAHVVTSYGLKVQAKDTGRSLVVRRKHSAEFILIVKGIFRPSYLSFLVQGLVESERETLLQLLSYSRIQYLTYCSQVLRLPDPNSDYNFVVFHEHRVLLQQLLEGANVTKNTLRWSWPKGRLNYYAPEDEYACALREFQEEVEAYLPPALTIEEEPGFEEVRVISGEVLRSKYWKYTVAEEFKVTQPLDHLEVSERAWFTENELQVKLK